MRRRMTRNARGCVRLDLRVSRKRWWWHVDTRQSPHFPRIYSSLISTYIKTPCISKSINMLSRLCSYSIGASSSGFFFGGCRSAEFRNSFIPRSWAIGGVGLVTNMASEGRRQFPPQKQQAQPGKEHVMDPTPQFTSPDYRPANKLQAPFFSI